MLYKAVQELFKTEERYKIDLYKMKFLFIDPLRTSKFISPEQHETLFNDLPQIIVFHDELFQLFQKRWRNWDNYDLKLQIVR